MAYPQICQTCFYSGGLAPAEQYPAYTKPLFCRKPETLTEKVWPTVWPVVEASFTCLNWKIQPTLVYHLTGTITPNATGEYIRIGSRNGYPFFVHVDGEWCISYNPAEWSPEGPPPPPNAVYEITRPDMTWSEIPQPGWERASTNPVGQYGPNGWASGMATLHEGPT